MPVLTSSAALAAALILTDVPVAHEITESRGLIAEREERGGVTLFSAEKLPTHSYAWVTSCHFTKGADLSESAAVVTAIENRSFHDVETMLWVCGKNGWSSVGDFATLAPGESRKFRANLWETFPDGTLKLHPAKVSKFQIMVRGAKPDLELRVEPFSLEARTNRLREFKGRVHFPELTDGEPGAGRRVQFYHSGGAYAVLYLPSSWEPGKKIPVIVEYPGNIFFNAKCYSTGRPEQCVIGYGMTRGEGSIILSLPFVDRNISDVVESGFGDPDETVAYAKEAIERVIEEFGGDRENMVLTGFSRGSIACGFIGLRDDKIASYWKGIHGCQHYDGSEWRESNMEDAIIRAKRFRGKAIFQTDNNEEKYAPVVKATDPGVEWTWVSSGLGFHATSMFLDDRPSTVQLREWYRKLVSSEGNASEEAP